jgi:hypothetical protein
MNAVFDTVGAEPVWCPTRTQHCQLRSGATVAELTSIIEDRTVHEKTRLSVLREPLHPEAQGNLIASLDEQY